MAGDDLVNGEVNTGDGDLVGSPVPRLRGDEHDGARAQSLQVHAAGQLPRVDVTEVLAVAVTLSRQRGHPPALDREEPEPGGRLDRRDGLPWS